MLACLRAPIDVRGSIENARITPGTAQSEAGGIKHVVVALCSMFTFAPMDNLPSDSIAVTFGQHVAFHGALHQHPAASFRIRVNVDGVTALRGLFRASAQAGASMIAKGRKENPIASFDNLKTLLGESAENLWEDADSLCIFAL